MKTTRTSAAPLARHLRYGAQAGRRKSWRDGIGLAAAALLLASCALVPPEDLMPPERLEVGEPREETAREGQLAEREDTRAFQRDRRFTKVPPPPQVQAPVRRLGEQAQFPADEEAAIQLSVDGLPLPAFINEVFGNTLKMDFQMAPEVADKTDLVTVRVSEPRNRQDIFEMSRDVLKSYGVLIVQQGEYLRFILGKDGESGRQPPLIVTGQALPSVPATHRPVIFIRTLRAIPNAEAYGMLREIFQHEQRLTVQRDQARNAVRLQGPPDLVESAAGILDTLDQPLMKGRHALRIQPMYADPETLASRLRAALGAQGFDIGDTRSNTTLVPIKELDSLFVFAPDEAMLQLVREWTKELDQLPIRPDEGEEGLYWYRVRNTAALDLAATLNAVMQGEAPRRQEGAEDRRLQGRTDQAGAQTGGAAVPTRSGQFVVSQARNLLLFRGEPEQWQRMLPLIRELDHAPDQVMIEVIVAEVTLADDFRFGVEWALSQISVGGVSGPLTGVFGDGAPGAGLDAGGLAWTAFSNSGQTRLALNAFASSNRVSILQTPRILVRSGESATVQVGSEVPIITRQATGEETIEGTSAIIQDVQFRSTGVQLTVLPTVFSDGRIDLEINQEVSEALPTLTSNINSPTIFNRSINTRLSLEDGASILLGGLISNSESRGGSRIPILGDIPILGKLFSTDNTSADRTEMMILVVPYLIRDGRQAESLTRSFRERLQLHPQPDELIYKPPPR